MAIKMNTGNIPLNTPLPNAFIDDYMSGAPAVYSMVYILSLRHCIHGGESITIGEISQKLNILESDVINAWKHWEKEGLIKILDGSIENFSIEFYIINKKKAEGIKEHNPEAEIRINLAAQPSYSPKEIEIYMERSPEIRRLFKCGEDILAKPLTYSDLNMLLSFFEWYALPIDVIEIMLEYCVSNNKKGRNYLETVARDWSENGITTAGAAYDYIDTFNIYNKILKAFGITGKTPNKKQIAFMKKWLHEFKMPFEIIAEACETTFLQTGKAKFEYADKILCDWYDKEISTIEDVNKDSEAYLENKKNRTGENFKTVVQNYKNRFINYEQREWDYEKIEKLSLEQFK